MTQDPSPTLRSLSSPLEGCNRTELYQLCFRAGLKVHPRTPREWLIGYLTGEADPPLLDEQAHPIDRWRVALIGFIRDYWETLHPQLTCPAKDMKHLDASKRKEKPCFGCTDLKVLHCINQNVRNEERIKLYMNRRNP